MKILKKIKDFMEVVKIKICMAMTMVIAYMYCFNAYADVESDLKKTKLFKGTVDVLKGVSNALLAITVLVTIALSIAKGIQWQTADEQEKPMKKKALISTIAIGILIASIAGLIGVILKAYGLQDETNSGLAAAVIYYLL